MVPTTCIDCNDVSQTRRCADCQVRTDRVHNRASQRQAYKDPLYRSIPIGPRCVVCGSTIDLTKDHKIALSNGGSNAASNIRTLCRICNSEKGSK